MATKKPTPDKQVVDDAPEAVVVKTAAAAPTPASPAMTPDQAMVYAALNAGVAATQG